MAGAQISMPREIRDVAEHSTVFRHTLARSRNAAAVARQAHQSPLSRRADRRARAPVTALHGTLQYTRNRTPL